MLLRTISAERAEEIGNLAVLDIVQGGQPTRARETRSFADHERRRRGGLLRFGGAGGDDRTAHVSTLRNVGYDCNTPDDDDSNSVVTGMHDSAERLKQSRMAAGFATAADAARRFGWPVVTYQSHESGTRGLRAEPARRYAAAFGVSDAWLLTGKGDRDASGTIVKVVGYVGAGAQVLAFANDEPFDGLDEIEAPAGTSPDAKAVIVRGDSAYPIFEDGEVLIFSEQRSDVDTFLYRAKPMIVALRDGRRLLKTVARGTTRGRYTLMSQNAAPLENVDVEWVSRLDWTRPRR